MRLMLYGLAGSIPTLTAMIALSGDPAPVGVNVTAIVQLESGDAEPPQVPPVTEKSPAFVPLKLSLTGSGNPDRFFTVTFFVFEDCFDVSVLYAIVAGVTVAGIVAPVLSATVYGLSGSGLSETDSAADSVPSAPGVKVTAIVQVVLAARLVVQVPPVIEKSAASVPLKLLLSVTG